MPEMDGLSRPRGAYWKLRDRPGPADHHAHHLRSRRHVYEALRIGCSGFLLKDAPAEELSRAVRVAVTGEALLAPTVTCRLIEDVVTRGRRPRREPAELTSLPRERETVEQIATGRSNAEIAGVLFISEEQTVKTHVRRVSAETVLRDRAQVVVYAYENGVVWSRTRGRGRKLSTRLSGDAPGGRRSDRDGEDAAQVSEDRGAVEVGTTRSPWRDTPRTRRALFLPRPRTSTHWPRQDGPPGRPSPIALGRRTLGSLPKEQKAPRARPSTWRAAVSRRRTRRGSGSCRPSATRRSWWLRHST